MKKQPYRRIAVSISALALGGLMTSAGQSTASVSVILPAEVPALDVQAATAPKSLVQVMGQSKTDLILKRLREAEDECGKLPFEYRTDCLAKGFRAASNEMRGASDYNGAKRAIDDASRKLDQLVKANLDKEAPLARAGNIRRVRAVKKAAVAQVLNQSRAIVAEAETKLIRSAGSSKKKLLHYTQIAEAVGSTKKLLRST